MALHCGLANLTHRDPSLSEGTRGEKERAKLTHQKQGYSGAQDEACNHVGAVVPVLGDPIEARQEGGAEGPEAQHGFSQPTALCLDCACDVHLERTETSEREAACLHAANTRTRTHAPAQANTGRAEVATLPG